MPELHLPPSFPSARRPPASQPLPSGWVACRPQGHMKSWAFFPPASVGREAQDVSTFPPRRLPPAVDCGPGLSGRRSPGGDTVPSLWHLGTTSLGCGEAKAWRALPPIPQLCWDRPPPPPPCRPAAINQEINNLLPPFLKPPLPFPVESPACLGTSQSGPPPGGPS